MTSVKKEETATPTNAGEGGFRWEVKRKRERMKLPYDLLEVLVDADSFLEEASMREKLGHELEDNVKREDQEKVKEEEGEEAASKGDETPKKRTVLQTLKQARDQEQFASLKHEAAILESLRNRAAGLAAKDVASLVAFPKVLELSEKEECLLLQPVFGESIWEFSHRLRSDKKMNSYLACDLALGMVECIRHLHEAGFLHRDLRPSSFRRRGEKGELMLVEFAHCKSVGVTEGQQQGGSEKNVEKSFGVRNRRYCSPFVHDKLVFTFRDDLFSVVFLFVELLGQGSLPWHSTSDPEAIHRSKKEFVEGIKPFADIGTTLNILLEGMFWYLLNLPQGALPDYDYFSSCIVQMRNLYSYDATSPWDYVAPEPEQERGFLKSDAGEVGLATQGKRDAPEASEPLTGTDRFESAKKTRLESDLKLVALNLDSAAQTKDPLQRCRQWLLTATKCNTMKVSLSRELEGSILAFAEENGYFYDVEALSKEEFQSIQKEVKRLEIKLGGKSPYYKPALSEAPVISSFGS